jgi:predicted ATP-grasp superfamily ATP-dependent carboligase
MRVLLTDGNERTTLAAARSLVAAGHQVHVVAPRRLSLAGVSRRVRVWPVAVDPLEDPATFAATVGRLAGAIGAHLVLPMTDQSVEAVLGHRRLLPERVCLPFNDLATWRFAADKRAMLPLARAAGFAVPKTVVLDSPAEAIVGEADLYPAVLKPHCSVVADARGERRRKVSAAFVSDPAACRAALAALPPAAFPVLLQRPVRGAGEGLFVLRWGGCFVAEFAHRRLRETPVQGGVSVYRESVPLDPEVLDAGRRLLDDLDWRGVAMIEYKRDAASGRPVFMEVNGRFWGSLQLAIDAGVDFPALLAAWVEDFPGPHQLGYRSGVRLRWWWGDVDHCYQRLREAATWRARLAALWTLLSSGLGRGRGDREEVWRWNDPLPLVVETGQWLAHALARRRRRPAASAAPLRGPLVRAGGGGDPRGAVLEADRFAPAQPRRHRVDRGHLVEVGLESEQDAVTHLEGVGERSYQRRVQGRHD